jgi:hypothetical protein
MTKPHPTLAAMSPEALRVADRRLTRIGLIALTAFASCFVAGIWFDWRWLATAVVPAVVGIIAWAAVVQNRHEIAQRICHAERSADTAD